MLMLIMLTFGMMLGYYLAALIADVHIQQEANAIRVEVGLPTKPVKYFR